MSIAVYAIASVNGTAELQFDPLSLSEFETSIELGLEARYDFILRRFG
jgi:hypothetical protein